MGAWLRHHAIEGNNDNPGVAGLLDHSVKRRCGSGIYDDRVVAFENEILHLRRLFGRRVIGVDDRRISDEAGFVRGRGDFIPALDHRLAE